MLFGITLFMHGGMFIVLHTSSQIQTEWAYQYYRRRNAGFQEQNSGRAADRRPDLWFYKILI
jgi:hypothetical protein